MNIIRKIINYIGFKVINIIFEAEVTNIIKFIINRKEFITINIFHILISLLSINFISFIIHIVITIIITIAIATAIN